MPPVTWREAAQRIIQKVVAEVGTEDPVKLKQALFDAYPWGPRRYHPYRMWREEVRKVLSPSTKSPEPSRLTPVDVKYFWIKEK